MASSRFSAYRFVLWITDCVSFWDLWEYIIHYTPYSLLYFVNASFQTGVNIALAEMSLFQNICVRPQKAFHCALSHDDYEMLS